MKILLFGAAGQLGRAWQVHFKVNQTNDVIIIPYISAQLDITRFEKVQHEVNKQQPDVIINCAAYTNVDEAEDERKQSHLVNAESVKNLAGLCKSEGIKVVHFSTDYIFSGSKEDQQRLPEGYPEEHQAKPVNWYGQTKWEGEQAIRNSGCRHLIMRVSWLCSIHGSNFVKTMLRLARDRTQLDVVDDQKGSPTFAHNLVQNTFKLIEENHKGTYNLTSKGLISWADFAQGVVDLSEKKVAINRIPSAKFPTKAARPFFSKLDTQKIEQISGIEIEPWRLGLKHLLLNLNQDS